MRSSMINGLQWTPRRVTVTLCLCTVLSTYLVSVYVAVTVQNGFIKT